jgi:hypothetical protein
MTMKEIPAWMRKDVGLQRYVQKVVGVAKRKRGPRKPTLVSELRQAKKAGLSVKGATIEPDGRLSLQFGEPEPTEASNPWLAGLEGRTRQ